MTSGVSSDATEIINIVSAGEEPGTLVQGVHCVDDLLLGQVVDGVPVEAPDLENTELCTSLVQC